MKIYTKTGDKGETGLVGGKRLQKDDLRIRAVGDIDELNAFLGICVADNNHARIQEMLHELQKELFDLGADLATPLDSKIKLKRISGPEVARLEQWIDEIDQQIEPLQNFILPGGSLLAAYLHASRAVCRRAERSVVTLQKTESVGPDVVKYVNRLSDLLFMMARFANKVEGVDEELWKR